MMYNIKNIFNIFSFLVEKNGFFKVLIYLISRSLFITKSLFILNIKSIPERKVIRHLVKQKPINCLVSVVIPNNNGMALGLPDLIRSIRRQTHKNIEIISVDSGSKDNSVQYMQSQGVKVYQIQPQDFSHSYSRNLGASHANGDFILFTVSDANFYNPNWIEVGIKLLNHYKAASYCTPQGFDDCADIYARLLASSLFNRFPKYSGLFVTKPILVSQWLITARLASVLYGVDDTNHLVRRAVFEKIKFKVNTVEDMWFGRDLLHKGHKLILSNINSIRHYHKYSDRYKYFCRVYSDSKIICQLVNEIKTLNGYDDIVFKNAYTCTWILNNFDQYFNVSRESYIDLDKFKEILLHSLSLTAAYLHLNVSIVQRSLDFLSDFEFLKCRDTYLPSEIEFSFLRKKIEIALSSAFQSMANSGKIVFTYEEIEFIVTNIFINLIASQLALLELQDPDHAGEEILRHIKWR